MITEVTIIKRNLRNVLGFVADTDRPRRELMKMLPSAFDRTVEYWHSKMLPEHFTVTARQKYTYAPRSSKYRARKMRQKGHDLDLVWTGNMQRQVTSAIRLQSNSRGGRGALLGPRYLYQYRKDYGQADKAAEVTRTTREELGVLARFLNDRVQEHLTAPSNEEERF